MQIRATRLQTAQPSWYAISLAAYGRRTANETLPETHGEDVTHDIHQAGCRAARCEVKPRKSRQQYSEAVKLTRGGGATTVQSAAPHRMRRY